MKCKKCEKNIPSFVIIDGKRRNLQNRKFCFDCSPFGSHNTLDLTKNKDSRKYNKRSELNCKQCNNKLSCRQKKGLICWNCHNAKTRLDRKIEVIKLLGSKCCICGYDKCRQALEIHHVNPKDKKMGLSLREMSFKWEDILNELKKCVLLCCLCHREYHSGLISQAEIENNWNEATAPYPNPSY